VNAPPNGHGQMSEAGLHLEAISIRLGGRLLLEITHDVAPGDVLTVMGPSGSGKSSLLAFIAGFLDPAFEARGRATAGDVDLTALPAEDRHVGILFQDPLLFPHMSVAGNVAFAVPASIGGRARRRAMADAALAGVGLETLGDRDTDTLSGGQKARVALARVLVSGPRALLLDEPFSKLDTALRQQVRELVFSRVRDSRLPAILVTHDEADAMAAGGPVIRLDA
jgi:putative thiamine transport system ATP-binding protein